MPASDHLLAKLRKRLGPAGLLDDAAARRVYARDASHLTLGRPVAVALPGDAAAVAEVVRLCAAAGVPIVTRGTGTGLSGGAVPHEGELVLSTARLDFLGPADASGRRVRAGAGVLNEKVSAHTAPQGLHFAPDPSSQSASSIGGNIAENAGGPHCLRHGVTLPNLLRLEWCDTRGRGLTTGRGLSCERGLDLLPLLCGSEGTLGVVTAADLKLAADPAGFVTMAAFFPDLHEATAAVVALLGSGLLPVAVEMVDQPMLEAVEAAFGFGFPTDVAAAMILEFAGGPQETGEDAARTRQILSAGGAREVRTAADEAARLELWNCRKKAFGAVGRLAPSYVTMDVVVPLGQLPALVQEIQEIKAQHGVEIATAFHAGDGNLHPGVHYDDRDQEQTRAAHAAADRIMTAALARGGSVTGEHGIGIEKLHAAPWQLDRTALDLMWGIKRLFDPLDLLNPGKALPAADSACAAPPPVPGAVTFAWDSLTVTAPADASLADLQEQALARGLWLPVGLAAPAPAPGTCGLAADRTVGSLVADLLLGPALLAGGTARDFLLEVWAETGGGRALHAGAAVFKNVAGFNLAQMLCGTGHVLAEVRAATFQLRPAAEAVGLWRFTAEPGSLSAGMTAVGPVLAARDDVRGGPICILEDTAGPAPATVLVLAAGRDRSWDLGELGGTLGRIAAGAGWALQQERRTGLPSWKDFLADLPGWAQKSRDWTVLASLRSEEGGGSPAFPDPLPQRLVWQARPRLVWTPGLLDAPRSWHADPCCREGRPTSLPRPTAGVPMDILRGLKHLFDPDGRLETPAWLAGDGDE